MRTKIKQARRLVVKVGSALVTNNGQGLDHAALADWARQIAELRQQGRQVALVSSGAIAAGLVRLGWTKRPHEMHKLQAAAAVGQTHLMGLWASAFAEVGKNVGQVLLTNDGLADRRRYVTARQAMGSLLSAGIVPIVNENDAVSVDEIMVGDNDSLAAMTAALVDAHLLVLLTDVAGVYREDPANTLAAEPVAFARGVDELREFCYRKTAAESIGARVLLGMSFLSRTQIEHAQDALVLRRKY